MADPVKLAEHVKDSDIFELPFQTHIPIPQPFEALGLKLHLTKFMVLELVVAVLMLLIFIPLARRIRNGEISRGRFWNMFEAMLLFVRDKMVRPAIGHHDADRFLPFIWTLFFFILILQSDGPAPLDRIADGRFRRHQRIGSYRLCHGDRSGHEEVSE